MSLSQVRRRGAALTLALALGALTACGSSDSSSSAATTTAGTTSSSAADTSASAGTSASASDSGAAATTAITATEADFSIKLDGGNDLKAGEYTINVTNTGNATHDLVVEQNGKDIAKSDTLRPGSSGSLSVTLQPGSYVFYCSIGNHRAMGMEVNVTVS
jgi:plastocyanin